MKENGCQAAKAHMETARAHLDNAKLQEFIKEVHYITDAQIRKAWEIYESLAVVEAHGLRVQIERIFKELGIERCEGCGGVGLVENERDCMMTSPCPNCNGKGWTIK